MKTIKMLVYNSVSEKWEEVFPKDGVPVEKLVPAIWDDEDECYGCIPNLTAAEVYDQWIEEHGE